MSNWDKYEIAGEVSEAAGDRLYVPEDIYLLRVMDVSDVETKPNQFKERPEDPDTVDQFVVSWEVLPREDQNWEGAPETIVVRQWINLPDGFLKGPSGSPRRLSPKSWLYRVMDALHTDAGEKVYEMSGFVFRADHWIDLRAKALIRTPEGQWPRIVSFSEFKRKVPAAAGKPSTTGSLRSRLER